MKENRWSAEHYPMRPDLAKMGDIPSQKIALRSCNYVKMNRAWGTGFAGHFPQNNKVTLCSKVAKVFLQWIHSLSPMIHTVKIDNQNWSKHFSFLLSPLYLQYIILFLLSSLPAYSTKTTSKKLWKIRNRTFSLKNHRHSAGVKHLQETREEKVSHMYGHANRVEGLHVNSCGQGGGELGFLCCKLGFVAGTSFFCILFLFFCWGMSFFLFFFF